MANGKDVALLGTGIIGTGVCKNLLDAGHKVTVWNRTIDKARPLEQNGARVASTAAEAVDGTEFVLTTLADGHAVREVMLTERGALEGMGRDSVWIQMSTVGIDEVEEFDTRAKGQGVHLVDAPVLGTKGPAEKGQLTVLAAGSSRIVDRCDPIFDAVGRRTMKMDKPCHATRLKLVINDWVLGLLGVLAETFASARAMGVRPEQFLEAISGGALDAGYAHIKGQMMLQNEFPPSFPLRLALKDARLIQKAAHKHGFEPRIMATIAEYFEQALDDGHGDEDMSAIIQAMREA
jgi:3-hydroxyisobutyrate dehydrogenase